MKQIGSPSDGPLPQALLLLTCVTGIVDAVSYLGLGHVFVANMTGNVVFLAFATIGADGFTPGPSLLAIFGFLGGAIIGGRTAKAIKHRARLLLITTYGKIACVVTATLVAALVPTSERAIPLILILSCMMGIQNAVARKLAVPDLTTTVLTLTLTGIAADSRLAGGPDPRLMRRVLSVACMFLGALVGSILTRFSNVTGPLLLALFLYAITALIMLRHRNTNEAWTSM